MATATAIVTVTNNQIATAKANVVVGIPTNQQSATASDTVVVTTSGQVATASTTVTVTALGAVVSAGRNITLEANASTTVVGTVTPRSGTTIVSVSWDTGGNVVSNTNSLVIKAPLGLTGATRVYTFSVTDSNGTVSKSNMVATFLPATRRIKIGGVIRPSARRMIVGKNESPAPEIPADVPITLASLRQPIDNTAPNYTPGNSLFTVNPDRTTL